MEPRNTPVKYDVIIIGAGPAGCACALALKGSGLKVALVEKQVFPRDKVCGDAIPGRGIRTLNKIDPAFGAAFKTFSEKCETKKTSVFYKGESLSFNWVLDAYTCTRMQFDNFMFQLVEEHTATDIYTGTVPDAIAVADINCTVTLKNNSKILRAPIVIGADGAHSVVAKQLTNQTLDRKHHVGSVRAYYTNVAYTDSNTMEIYFDKQFLPSYLWVFPLPGNMANVGFGMLSDEISKRKINIRKTFYEFIERSPVLKEKFSNAKQVGELEGFGLPLGSRVGTLSGAHFMLTGDAASLIDPITGDGIGNAMLSGRLAAEQVVRCFEKNDFTAPTMKRYDSTLLGELGHELATRYRAQRTLSKMPFLLDVVFMAGKNKTLKKLIQKQL